jgi:hypothetical protein
MAVWDRDQVALHPFGHSSLGQNYGPFLPPVSPRTALQIAQADATSEWGLFDGDSPKIRSVWMRRNTLDPLIHQAVFHFLRGQRLLGSAFDLEAIVAFDCVFQTVGTLLSRGGTPTRTRAEICKALGFSSSSGRLAEHAYFLRNHFGAHPGGWRWWDYGELLEDDDALGIARLAGRSLARAADREPALRIVDPAPASWADWFVQNFNLLWDVVWFDRMHAR